MEAREVSRWLFGRPCRLPIALWILKQEKGRFYQSEPPRELGVQSAITEELARFTRAGLLTEERPDAENRVYYVRTDSPLWKVIEAARLVIDDDDDDR